MNFGNKNAFQREKYVKIDLKGGDVYDCRKNVQKTGISAARILNC